MELKEKLNLAMTELANLIGTIVDLKISEKLGDKLSVTVENIVETAKEVTPVDETPVAVTEKATVETLPLEEEVAAVAPAPTDDVAVRIEAYTKDMSDDDLKELLQSFNLSIRGKRQAWLSKLITAVKEGVVEFSDDDADEEEAETEAEPAPAEPTEAVPAEAEEEEAETAEVSDDREPDSKSEVDGDEYFNTETMTPARKKRIKAGSDSINAELEAKKFKFEEILPELDAFYGKGAVDGRTKEEKFLLYKKAHGRMIDDDGNAHEMGECYHIDGYVTCCGHFLQQEEGKADLVCKLCGAIYTMTE